MRPAYILVAAYFRAHDAEPAKTSLRFAPNGVCSLNNPLTRVANRLQDQPSAQRGRNETQLQKQKDILDQLNSIYEELLASQEWPREGKQPGLTPSRQPLSVFEITRYLAGWPSPRPEALRVNPREMARC